MFLRIMLTAESYLKLHQAASADTPQTRLTKFVHDMMAFTNEVCDTLYDVYPTITEHEDCELLVRNGVDPVVFDRKGIFWRPAIATPRGRPLSPGSH